MGFLILMSNSGMHFLIDPKIGESLFVPRIAVPGETLLLEKKHLQVAQFAESLPFATYRGKHDAAAVYFTTCDALIVMVQESRHLDDHPTIRNTSARSLLATGHHSAGNDL